MAGSDGKRDHALLAPSFGQPGPPFLPTPGQIYWLRSLLYSSTDRAGARPAVVLDVPNRASARIRIVTRTHQSAPGIRHPADPSLSLNSDGVFSVLTSVERSMWRPENVKLCGLLDEEIFKAVQERFD